MHRIVLGAVAALALAAAGAPAHAQVTACMKESAGTLKKFAFGDAPFKPCKDGKEVPVALLTAGLCGNGALEAGEVCDDGNTFEDDGCSSSCAFEAGACGDGVTNLSEQCDDGNLASGDGCSSQCLGETDLATIPFYVVLDADQSTSPIATIGEFSVFARCLVADGGTTDRVRIIATRTSAGWFTDATGAAAQGAGAEVAVIAASAPTNATSYANDIDEAAIAGPDGIWIGIDGETTALGVNVFGHRCFAAGLLHTMTGFIPEVPVP